MSSAIRDLPKHRCELHVHLDGSLRPQTIYDVARRRGLKLPAEEFEEFKDHVTCCYGTNKSLLEFLNVFYTFHPLIRGDTAAIEQFAYEFCEDEAKQKVAYCELRYSPHYLAELKPRDGLPYVSAETVVRCVNNGLRRGCHEFGVKIRTILCCMTDHPEWSMEIVALADKFRNEGVVGIDVAGEEILDPPAKEIIDAFTRAKELGISRTVHAGESGGAQNVLTAVEVLHAERIGHGYHVLEDQSIYKKMKSLDIHFEVCPVTSLITRSQHSLEDHAIRQFDVDRVNYSLNTDDPGITQKSLNEEHLLAVNQLDLDSCSLTRCAFNAATSSFLPKDEKQELIDYLKTMHGIPTETSVTSLSNLFP
ncbi:adenosine deaminase-like [Corticium candelabrum]|uniref:adenosine deaminase-like n=1 Tax=Corticium candelabrum TaxID=121492 RepID=UPI002E252762|nr:adenosine deaminase-like [Corticium candelabrum]